MLERVRGRRRTTTDDGFTLVELLVAVVVVGVLLTIALPLYAGAQSRARIRAAQANLRSAVGAVAAGSNDAASVATDSGLRPVAGSSASTSSGEVSVTASSGVVGLAVAGPDDRCFLARRTSDGTVRYGAYRSTTGCTGDEALLAATATTPGATATYAAQALATPDLALMVRGSETPPTALVGTSTLVNGSGPLPAGGSALSGDDDGSITFSLTGGVQNGPHTTADDDALDIGTGSLTVAFWYREPAVRAGTIVRKSDGANASGWILDTNGGSMQCRIDVNGTLSVASATNVQDDAWHHIACVIDRATPEVRLYVDGHLDTSASAAVLAGRDLNAAAYLQTNTYGQLGGQLDELSVYRRALTATEVGRLADAR